MNVITISETSNKTTEKIAFHWGYIALPLAILFLAVVSAAAFYGKLPHETAYRFSGGVAVSQTRRGALLAWSIGLQLIFVFIAAIILLLVINASLWLRMAENQLNKTLIGIMGNLMVLPQIIIFYVILDIFLYNIYGKALPALWAFGMAVLVVGAIVILVVFFESIYAVPCD